MLHLLSVALQPVLGLSVRPQPMFWATLDPTSGFGRNLATATKRSPQHLRGAEFDPGQGREHGFALMN
jgi:hypothetical protein